MYEARRNGGHGGGHRLIVLALIMALGTATWVGGRTLDTGATATVIDVGQGPDAIIADPVQDFVYAVNSQSNNVSVIDTVSDSVTATVPVRPSPLYAAFDPGSNTIFVPSNTVNSIDLLDTSSMTVTAVIPSATRSPGPIAFDPLDQVLYVASTNEPILQPISIRSSGFNKGPVTHLDAVATDVQVVNGSVYVAQANGSIAVVGYQLGGRITERIPIGGGIHRLSYDPNIDSLFVSGPQDQVTVFGLRSRQTTTIPLASPWGIAVNTATRHVFVTQRDLGSVAVIDDATLTLVGKVPVGHQPSSVAVLTRTKAPNPAEGRVFVSNTADNTVTQFLDLGIPPDLFTLPVRPCAIEGSAAAPSETFKFKRDVFGQPIGPPYVVGNEESDSYLINELERASDDIWLPGGHIIFRNAVALHFPIIADPYTQDTEIPGKGQLGDLGIGNFYSSSETDLATQECQAAWGELYPEQRGIIAVTARQFVNEYDGIPVRIGGVDNLPSCEITAVGGDCHGGNPGKRSYALCSYPRHLTVMDVLPQLAIAIADFNQISATSNNGAAVLAHELGHALLLGHGNGVDPDHDGADVGVPGPRLFDSYCDPPIGDDPPVGCGSVMNPEGTACRLIQPLQAEEARDTAFFVPGGFPLLGDPAGETVAPTVCARRACPTSAALHLVRVGVAETPTLEMTHIYQQLSGPVGDAPTRYVTMLDTDSDPATGCQPSDLGLPTRFQGAEIVSILTSIPQTGGRQPAVTAELWRCFGGKFTQIRSGAITASASDVAGESGPPSRVITVSVSAPDQLIGYLGHNVRVQALTQRLHMPDAADRWPPGYADGQVIGLEPPPLPSCDPVRPKARPGSPVLVRSAGQGMDVPVVVDLGALRVGTTPTTTAGSIQSRFGLPADVTTGRRLVTVRRATAPASRPPA